MRTCKSFGLLALVAMSGLGGCQATGTAYSDGPAVPAAPPGRGLVFVYQMPSVRQQFSFTKIVVDERNVATLHADGYTYLYLTAGLHRITETPGGIDFSGSKSVELNLQPGETVYIELATGLKGGGDTMDYITEFGIRPPDVGRLEIRRRHFEPAGNVTP
jgi:hypothetical protein